MTTGPQDPAASRDRLRAGHADREQVIEALKTAFVDGRLTKNELAARTGRALAARTYADLAALTADIPAEPAAAALVPPRPSRVDRGGARAGSPARPGGPPASGQGGRRIGRVPGHRGRRHRDRRPHRSERPRPQSPSAWVAACFSLALGAVIIAAFTVFLGVAVAIEQRRSRRQPPPRSGPGGRTLDGERHNGTSHDPVPPALAPTRPAPTCGLARRRRPGGASPPGRAWHRVASARYQERLDAYGTGSDRAFPLSRGRAG